MTGRTRHGYSRVSKRDLQVNYAEVEAIELQAKILERIRRLVEAGKKLEKEGIWKDG